MVDEKYEPELLRLVVDEVDAARDTLELAGQLARALPLTSFDDIVRCAEGQEGLRFRGVTVDVQVFRDVVPQLVFPINDLPKLVQLCALAASLAPAQFGRNLADVDQATRFMRRQQLRLALSAGRIGPAVPPTLGTGLPLGPAGFDLGGSKAEGA